ncbi:GDSL-type esterase/lipase family protein [Thermophilibacter provencensis]|uniref:GDSL-type esterase/lipase family protein n=1 Tax=Thermophilibacter provencensis TaxID=1852386 RepID=UPI002353C12D|nr:GDSL-type esterase/lipase family protein [Thermophilibacter provencensis]
MIRRIIGLLCMLLLCCGMVPASASAAGTGSYVALGDSISAGYGLSEGEPSFPERLAQSTGYALADFSSSEGVTSQALLETLSQPEVADAVKSADVITITVGGNDLMNALYEYLAEASGTMAADEIREGLENGSFDVFTLMGLMQQLNGFPISSQASAALTTLRTNLSRALEQIKGMNPDATCIVANQYNPYGHINNPFAADIVSTFEVGVQALNTTLAGVAQARGATVVDVHGIFAASSTNPCNAYFTGLDDFSLDFHPNALGHQLIAEAVEQALPKPDPAQTYDVWVAGTQVSDDNAGDVLGDGTVSYDPASNTLTLNNAIIDYQENQDDNTKGAILFNGDLNVKLVGKNVITSVTSGIYANGAGDLVITGDALTVDAVYYGIGSANASRNVTISGVDLDVDVDRRSPFIGVGIQAGGQLLITDGTVAEVTGTGADTHPVIGNGGVSIVDSEVHAWVDAEGQYANSMILSDHDITIDNSIVEAIADDTYDFGILAGNDLIPSEGTITIKNNSQVTVSAASGIAVHTMVGDVVIEDSEVVATSSGHNAMYVNGDITISGASDVTVSSPYAAFAPDDSITIDPKGGLVDVWEGSSEENASKMADSPLSQSATLEIASKFFHSAPHVHAFTERVEDDAYLASMATCTDPAAYYLSCECGAAGTDTFSAGSALGHSWGEWEVVTPATCTEPGVEGRTCASCGATESREIAATGHDFVDGACAACGEKDPSFVIPDEPKKDEPKKSDPVKDESALPAAGDAGSLAALVPALAGASALATGILLRRRG